MIRTAEKTPEWLYTFITKVPNEELGESALTALALEPVRSVEVSVKRPVETYWSDGRFADPYTPIHVPGQSEQTVRVEYQEELPMGYMVDYGWKVPVYASEEKYGFPEPFDSWYHTFRCSDIKMFYLEEFKAHWILWLDIYTATWYTTYVNKPIDVG